jgi:hypothetical protein
LLQLPLQEQQWQQQQTRVQHLQQSPAQQLRLLLQRQQELAWWVYRGLSLLVKQIH